MNITGHTLITATLLLKCFLSCIIIRFNNNNNNTIYFFCELPWSFKISISNINLLIKIMSEIPNFWLLALIS
jgi:hypothetical protein